MCVNTAGLMCLQRSAPSVRLTAIKRLSNGTRMQQELWKATLVFKPFADWNELSFVSISVLNVSHPYSLQSRHRKFGACFYLPRTIAALCFPKLELLLGGNRYGGRMYQSPLIVEDHILCYRRGIVVSVCPPPLLFFVVSQKKFTVLSLSWCSVSTLVWRCVGMLTVWQECHLLASHVTASGDWECITDGVSAILVSSYKPVSSIFHHVFNYLNEQFINLKGCKMFNKSKRRGRKIMLPHKLCLNHLFWLSSNLCSLAKCCCFFPSSCL